MDRLARQQRATSLRTWTDNEGMWNLKARFDPILAGENFPIRADLKETFS